MSGSAASPAPQPSGLLTFETTDRGIYVYLGLDDEDCYVECSLEADADDIAAVLHRYVYPHGYELIPRDECEPTLLPNGATRIYCAVIIDQVEKAA